MQHIIEATVLFDKELFEDVRETEFIAFEKLPDVLHEFEGNGFSNKVVLVKHPC